MADEQATSVSKFLKMEHDIDLIGAGSEGKVRARVPTDKYYQLQQEMAENPMSTTTSDPEKLARQQAAMLDSLKEEQELDIAKIQTDMRTNFGVPEDEPIVLNKQSEPIQDSPLSFTERYKFDNGTARSDKHKILAKKFGPENVKYDPATKEFTVNDNGVWHNANATGLAGEAANVDVYGGAALGAMAGSPLGPVGMAVGAGIGAWIGRAGTIQEAKMRGLRTEEDAKETEMELRKQFLVGMASEVGGLFLKAGGKVISKGMDITDNVGRWLRDSYNNISKQTAPWMREKVALNLSRHAGGEFSDNLVTMNHPEEVGAHGERYYDFLVNSAKDPSLTNPLQVEQEKMLVNAANTVKETMTKRWQDSWAQLSERTKDVKVNLKAILDDARSQFKDMGLVDEEGFLLKPDERNFPKTIDPKNIRKAIQAYNTLANAAEKSEGTVTFDQALTLKQNMGELVEWVGGTPQMSSVMEGRIARIRGTIDNELWAGLQAKDKNLAELFINMNKEYAPARNWLEKNASRFQTEGIQDTLKEILESSGAAKEELVKIFESNGVSTKQLFRELHTRKAGMGLVDTHVKANTGIIMGGEKSFVKNTVNKMAGTNRARPLPQGSAPLSQQRFTELQTRGQLTDFVTALSPEQKRALLNTRNGLDALTQIGVQAATLQSKTANGLLQKAFEASTPSPTPLQPPEETKKAK